MNRNRLGNSDLFISEVSFGCMSLGRNQQENDQLLGEAMDKGVNFFDTADLYDQGWNEESVGQSLKSRRKDVYLATKVGNIWNEDGKTWRWGPNKAYILQAIEKSLQRLQTDYVDLYQLHGGMIEDPIDEIIEAFELLKEQGKIRAYGISSIRPNTIRAYIRKSTIDSVMMQYSLLDRRPEETILDELKEAGISVITRGTLGRGLLINKPPTAYLDYSEEEISLLQTEISKLGKSTALAMRYVLEHPVVSSVVAGIRTENQLLDILEAIAEKVEPETLAKAGTIVLPKKYTNHR